MPGDRYWCEIGGDVNMSTIKFRRFWKVLGMPVTALLLILCAGGCSTDRGVVGDYAANEELCRKAADQGNAYAKKALDELLLKK
jgi:hypothetical protein